MEEDIKEEELVQTAWGRTEERRRNKKLTESNEIQKDKHNKQYEMKTGTEENEIKTKRKQTRTTSILPSYCLHYIWEETMTKKGLVETRDERPQPTEEADPCIYYHHHTDTTSTCFIIERFRPTTHYSITPLHSCPFLFNFLFFFSRQRNWRLVKCCYYNISSSFISAYYSCINSNAIN